MIKSDGLILTVVKQCYVVGVCEIPTDGGREILALELIHNSYINITGCVLEYEGQEIHIIKLP